MSKKNEPPIILQWGEIHNSKKESNHADGEKPININSPHPWKSTGHQRSKITITFTITSEDPKKPHNLITKYNTLINLMKF
jgi:hypothetical protein